MTVWKDDRIRMNIWKILGIEPTTDKRAIKKAYAAKTKEIHPEEKPEEFKQLYAAYQTALGFADHLKQVSKSGGSITSFYMTDEEPAESAEGSEDGGKGEKKLLSYFEDKQERQQTRVDAFVKYWQEMESPHNDPKMLDWWKEYLTSEEFQDIRGQYQVLHLLAEEIDKKFYYRLNELKRMLWDAYAFQEDGENAYHGDMKRLWKALYPAYKKSRRTVQDERARLPEKELLSFLEENQEKQEQRVDDFLTYWNALESPYRNPLGLDNLREYLFSAVFQDIRYHARVLKTLADEIDDKFFYGIDEVKILFWDAYGFQEDEENVYQGDRQRLWRSLYPAYEKRQQALAEEQGRIRKKKITCVMIGAAAAAVLAAILLSFVNEHTRTARECRFLIDYMEKQYPHTTFSEPELLGKNGFDGGNVYAMRSLTHPELSTDAEVYYKYVKGRKTRLVRENYERLLFEHHAVQYGLTPGWVNGFNAIIYTDVEELDAVCKKAEKMFLEQEELQTVTQTAFYTEQVLFPDVLFWGGLPPAFHAAKIQIFDLRQMNAAELAAQIRKTYMIYKFQYEAWNITAAQYREWGAAYETMCKEWENDDGEWLDVHDPDTGETLCRLFVSTYERPDTYSYRNGKAVPIYTRMMTLGNAYYFLQDQGANLTVREDGRGFEVTFFGNVEWFGYESEVKFDDLRDWY